MEIKKSSQIGIEWSGGGKKQINKYANKEWKEGTKLDRKEEKKKGGNRDKITSICFFFVISYTFDLYSLIFVYYRSLTPSPLPLLCCSPPILLLNYTLHHPSLPISPYPLLLFLLFFFFFFFFSLGMWLYGLLLLWRYPPRGRTQQAMGRVWGSESPVRLCPMRWIDSTGSK